MVREYLNDYYIPAAQRYAELRDKHNALTKRLARWKQDVNARFSSLRIEQIRIEGLKGEELMGTQPMQVQIGVLPGGMKPEELLVQLVAGPGDGNGFTDTPDVVDMARTACTAVVPEADDNNSFCIRTENDGVIIPNEMKEEIFKPFVRFNEKEDGKVTTGTGIGLALSRSLAELHQGTLAMGEGEKNNTFCLTLPIVQDMTITLTPEPEVEIDRMSGIHAGETEKKDNRPTVLVVEDNPDMLAFVVRQLSKEYTVLTATNGAEALQVLDGNYVNLVVSDVVMPVMDGFELCKTIKSDLNYSHIPVILLTAKTNIQSKIEGMELGADAYLEKPFSVEYLQACASSLIQNREKLRKAFAQSPFVAANTMALTKADEDFIKKLNEVIQVNYSNPEFSMDDMADSLNMSRSNFYRKIKGVLDLSPNEYLRLERLKRAAQLLKEGENRVNEICYMVGFNSPSYFAKCFQKQFGVLPKDFVS